MVMYYNHLEGSGRLCASTIRLLHLMILMFGPPTRNILSKLRILVSRGEFAVGEGEGGVAGAGVNNVKLFQGSTCRSDLTSVWSASPSLACDWLNLWGTEWGGVSGVFAPVSAPPLRNIEHWTHIAVCRPRRVMTGGFLPKYVLNLNHHQHSIVISKKFVSGHFL